MELYEAMRTTFAAREFTDEAIADEVLYRILDNARFAPSGGNRQGGRVIVVRDAATRERMAQLIAPPARRYAAQANVGENPWNTVEPTRLSDAEILQTAVPSRLIDPILRAPVVLVVCVDLSVVASMDQYLDRVGITSGASVYPLVWNILLAARNEGYGGVLTTFLTAAEPEAKRLLELPAEIAIAAVVPLGRPVKQLTKLNRKPVQDFVARERWGGQPFTAA
ncbi:MAG: nitroreductase family protein [Gammaproteobacteria bacterium]